MRDWNRTILIAVIAALGLLVLLRSGSRSTPGVPRLSAEFPGPWGGRALFLALGELGPAPIADFSPPLEWGRAAGNHPRVRAVLAPTRDIGTREAAAIAAWVQGGGRLVFSPSYLPDDATLKARPSARLEAALDEGYGSGEVLMLDDPAATMSSRLLGIPVPRSRLQRELEERGAWPAKLRGLRVGSGAVEEPGLAVDLVLNVLKFADGDRVHFDETAHGRGARIDPIARFTAWIVREPEGHTLAALLAVAVLALVCSGARRGPPLPLRDADPGGRSALEHVASLASLWATSGARRRPTVLLTQDLVRRVSSRGSASGGDELLLRRLRDIGTTQPDLHADAERIANAVSAGAVPSPAQLLELGQSRRRILLALRRP